MILILIVTGAQAQTPISGVINTYLAATAVNFGDHSLTLSSVAGIAVGDTVLIIQLRGAEINESNNSNYGDVDEWNGAGGYEYNYICDIQGNTVLFKREFLHDYEAGSGLQVVTLPTYSDAEVVGTLTATPWNGSSGGIVALRVSGTLELSADIDVSMMGFRGGFHDSSEYSCNWVTSMTDYSYQVSTGRGAWKGEGIANHPSENGGKGALANGGGGGNDHNSGGGGGGLMTSGGQGGDNDDPSAFNCHGYDPGVGGKGLILSGARMFFGGGGGAGHSNSGWLTTGGTGGGLILIECNQLVGNSFTLRSNGGDGLGGFGDGSGGGGAGGMICIVANSYSGTTNVEARGGDGGDSDGFSSPRCFGPGGGGSGGAIRVSGSSFPAEISYDLAGGTNGVVSNTTAACAGLAQNAAPGNAGVWDTAFFVPANYGGSVAQLDAENITICDEPSVTLDAENPGYTYLWSTGETTQTIDVNAGGTFVVTIGAGICSITDSIIVFECLQPPNTITPNGDGQNDTWIIDVISSHPNHTVQIFNRNGNVVFESSDYQNDWDGDGLPATTYYYYVDLGDGSDPVTGHLNILRE